MQKQFRAAAKQKGMVLAALRTEAAKTPKRREESRVKGISRTV